MLGMLKIELLSENFIDTDKLSKEAEEEGIRIRTLEMRTRSNRIEMYGLGRRHLVDMREDKRWFEYSFQVYFDKRMT